MRELIPSASRCGVAASSACVYADAPRGRAPGPVLGNVPPSRERARSYRGDTIDACRAARAQPESRPTHTSV